jgi:glucan phosphorylase
MTYLALNLRHYVNGVAKRHGEVSRLMFAGYEIDAITNGIHVPTWTSPAIQALFDWLNTPQPPLEASGTSGMKAAINGVPA